MILPRWLLVCCVCLLKLGSGNSEQGTNMNESEELWSGYTDRDYRKEIFPPVPSGEALQVGISVMVRDLLIKEVEGMMVMEVNLRVKWQDSRLSIPSRLSPGEYVPLDPAILNSIWVPDIYIGEYCLYTGEYIQLLHCMFVEVSCKMGYAWFPRDHQICNFRMESYAYSLKHNVYTWMPPGLEISDHISNEQFLVRFEMVDPYTRVYLPSGLFVVVSFVSLLVPAEAIPGRMTLCITTILTMSALLGVAMQSTPQVSYVRAIDVWLLSCLTFVSIVLLEFGIVIKMMETEKREKQGLQIPRVTKISIAEMPAGDKNTTAQQLQGPATSVLQTAPRARRLSAMMVEKVSLAVIPSCFLFFNVVYWWWFLVGSEAAVPCNLGKNITIGSS
ncbi:Gamma-aminobutyric acid receptor subunit rho-1-like 2 [Homarus americanus]|uniref:Gamma-aminobutyric acid receptor subunit rho-1-like 2 n=1 Tax=Homarus americanus TaxID=6706 RepID=A0A8J5JIC4_HOMAM|nr:Gamma-aminobutyric acid receptor subunit rho-1-like 2 [Homarus americanus]